MIHRIKKWNKLISGATSYLSSVLLYKQSSVETYNQIWLRVKLFMDGLSIKVYNREVEKKFMKEEFNDRELTKLTRWEKRKYYVVKSLTQFQEFGDISYVHREKIKLNFEGELRQSIIGFIEYVSDENSFSIGHRHRLEKNVFDFLQFCEKTGVKKLKELTPHSVIKYFGRDKPADNLIPNTLSRYFDYLFHCGILKANYSARIPRLKRIVQPKLPAVFKENEVENLIASIDRTSKGGIRDYALVLLAARLGIRAGDIANLKFENINWSADEINFNQLKTGEQNCLPLSAEVGNAIVDYIRLARPKSSEPNIFIRTRPPHVHFRSGCSLTTHFRQVFKKSGIAIEARRHGSHALRHSFGQRMYDLGVGIDVISSMMGHQIFESTTPYIRTSLKKMRICVLEAKRIDEGFFTQKGGKFYV